jgi:hypothetical protein
MSTVLFYEKGKAAYSGIIAHINAVQAAGFFTAIQQAYEYQRVNIVYSPYTAYVLTGYTY